MELIRCKACGKRYNYRTEGCCPDCGAYNRPPRKEWVRADGSIYVDTQQKKAELSSEKECYEKKVCYEKKFHEKSAPKQKTPQQSPQGVGKQTKKSTQIVAIALAVLSIAVSFFLDHINKEPSQEEYTDPVSIVAECNECVSWDQGEITVYGYITDEDGNLYVCLDRNVNKINLWGAALICVNSEQTYDAETYEGYTIGFGAVEPDAYHLRLYIDEADITVVPLLSVE